MDRPLIQRLMHPALCETWRLTQGGQCDKSRPLLLVSSLLNGEASPLTKCSVQCDKCRRHSWHRARSPREGEAHACLGAVGRGSWEEKWRRRCFGVILNDEQTPRCGRDPGSRNHWEKASVMGSSEACAQEGGHGPVWHLEALRGSAGREAGQGWERRLGKQSWRGRSGEPVSRGVRPSSRLS